MKKIGKVFGNIAGAVIPGAAPIVSGVESAVKNVKKGNFNGAAKNVGAVVRQGQTMLGNGMFKGAKKR